MYRRRQTTFIARLKLSSQVTTETRNAAVAEKADRTPYNALINHHLNNKTLPSSDELSRSRFVYLLPLSLTHFLTAFVSVNPQQLSGNTSKHYISKRHSLAPPSDPPQHLRFSSWLWRFINPFIYLLIYLLRSNVASALSLIHIWRCRRRG